MLVRKIVVSTLSFGVMMILLSVRSGEKIFIGFHKRVGGVFWDVKYITQTEHGIGTGKFMARIPIN